MKNEEIIIEFEKLERKHRISRWFNVILGLLIIGLGFYLIGDHELGYRDDFSLGNAISPIGGVLLGCTLSTWSGNSAYKLLKNVISNMRNGSAST